MSREERSRRHQQGEAINALTTGRIDAYASTAVGNQILADRIGHDLVDAASHAPGNLVGYSPRKVRARVPGAAKSYPP